MIDEAEIESSINQVVGKYGYRENRDPDEVRGVAGLGAAEAIANYQHGENQKNNLYGYAYSGACHKVINWIRAQRSRDRRERLCQAELANVTKSIMQSEPWPVEDLEKAIRRLSPEVRLAIESYYIHGRSTREIAIECGITQQAASERIRVGLKLLQEHFAALGYHIPDKPIRIAHKHRNGIHLHRRISPRVDTTIAQSAEDRTAQGYAH